MSDQLAHLAERESTLKKQGAAPATPVHAPAHPLVALQGQVGNRAVARMVQRAAEEGELQASHDVQRAEEEDELQASHDIQRAGEEDELQASHDVQRAGEEDELQASHDIQRAEEEDELQASHDVQRAGEEDELQAKHDGAPEVGLDGGPVSSTVESRINSARGSGSGLDDGFRDKMESAFGTSFGDVRIHRDAEADSLNRSITAKAFTTGNDIFLRDDVSTSDHHTLAHELTHVVQQRSGEVDGGPGMTVGAANHSSESEADTTAAAVLRGATVQRHGDDEHS